MCERQRARGANQIGPSLPRTGPFRGDLRWLGITAAVVVLDQISKYVLRSLLVAGQSITVIGDFLRLSLAHNTGASFGLFQGMRVGILIFSLAALAVFFYFMIFRPPQSKLMHFAIALAGGGVIGNLIDRIVLGRVTDFIDISIWPVFNVADIAITAGVGLIIYALLRNPQQSFSRDNGDEGSAGHSGAGDGK